MPDQAASFSDVLEQELHLIDERRRVVFGAPSVANAPAASGGAVVVDGFARAQRSSTFGLSFSGGGIRSATFNLGVLQGFAEKGLLPYVDYLSTVSGGGYIGAWLYGVMYRVVKENDEAAKTKLDDAQRKAIADSQLARARVTLKSGIKQEPGPSDQDPITFLRDYSNYLAPRPGLFSADTWTIGFIWLRNVLLNQLILVPAIAAVVAATLLLVLMTQWEPVAYNEPWGVDVWASGAAMALLGSAVWFMARELRGISSRSFDAPPAAKEPQPARSVLGLTNFTMVVALVFGTLLLLGVSHFELHARTRMVVILILIGLMATIQYAGGYVECHFRSHKMKLAALWDVLWMSTLSGALAGMLVTLVWDVMNGSSATAPWPPVLSLGVRATAHRCVLCRVGHASHRPHGRRLSRRGPRVDGTHGIDARHCHVGVARVVRIGSLWPVAGDQGVQRVDDVGCGWDCSLGRDHRRRRARGSQFTHGRR